MRRLFLMAVASIVATVIVTSNSVTQAQRPSVVTCTIQTETATGNSRTEVSYYECLAGNGAVVPGVTFVVFTDTPGELWLRQLDGATVDVRLEVVR